eukprot:427287_1
MASTISDYNAVSFAHFLLPECYITMIASMVFFALLFALKYYVLMPKFIHPRFDHIKTNEFLHWKIVDGSVSMIHGIVILLLCIIFHDVLFLNVTQNVTDARTTFDERMIASLSVGYFIYDTVVSVGYFNYKHTGKIDYIYILHHSISICCLTVCIVTVYSGKLCTTSLFLSEISNPLLHGNNLKNKFVPLDDQTMSKDFLARNIKIKLIYIITFSIARFMILPHILYQIMFVFECTIYIQIVGVLLIVLSIVLLPSLLKDLRKTYRKYKDNITDPNAMVPQQSDRSPSPIQKPIDEHYDEVLSLSKRSVTHFFVAGTVYSFFNTTRMAIYVLYAEGFDPSPQQIALLLYGFTFWNGVASLLYSALANQYGYDVILTLLLLLQSIAVLLESIAQSFFVLFIGAMLSQVAITYIVFGYIAWILPHEAAATYTSYFYGAFMVSYLIGPACAGFVSFYVSYRTVFVITCIMCFCALVHSFIYIFKTQKILESKQLLLGLLVGDEDKKQFPICLNRFICTNAPELPGDYHNGDESVDIDKKSTNNCASTQDLPQKAETSAANKSKWYTLPQLSGYEWFMLISIILINSTVSIGENAFVIYYSLYVVEELHSNVIIGTCGVVVMAVGFMIGNLVVPLWFKSSTDSKEEAPLIRNKYFVVVVCLMVLLLHTTYLFPFHASISLYWFLDFTVGLPLGILSMSTEIIVLEIQPAKDSGKISGAKGFIRNVMIAITLFIIAMFWDQDPNAFYFVVAASFGVALLLTVAMVSAKQFIIL